MKNTKKRSIIILKNIQKIIKGKMGYDGLKLKDLVEKLKPEKVDQPALTRMLKADNMTTQKLFSILDALDIDIILKDKKTGKEL